MSQSFPPPALQAGLTLPPQIRRLAWPPARTGAGALGPAGRA